MYKNATILVQLDERTTMYYTQLQRRMRQGDHVSLKLFTLALEKNNKKLKWNIKGMNIARVNLN